MFPILKIGDFPFPLYDFFNFLAVLMVIVLGLRWNYRRRERYPMGIGILLCVAPFAFILGRVFFYLFLACPSSKINFFNLERGGSMFLGALTGECFAPSW